MNARDLALAFDPVAFAAAAGFPELDPWQAQLLRSQSRRLILNCARQSGKTQITALLALHTAMYKPGALVLILSPGLRQSTELFRRVKAAYSVVHARGAACVQATRETELTLEFEHGSRIIALPGSESTVRGFARVNLLLIDEASRVEEPLFHSVLPMLAISRGRLILLSTPWAKQGFFHAAWEHGTGWERIRVTVHECPRISPEEVAEMRATLGPWVFARECLCEFGEADDAVFSRDVIERAFSPNVKALVLRRPYE